MRLYQAELYKLCHKKSFIAGVLCTFAVILVLFVMNVWQKASTVNGITYHGYAAIQTDKQITATFRGSLTDAKIQAITKQYGFPQKVEKYYGLTDANFLNRFVMEYTSDGYIRGWDDYSIATKSLPLAETALGQAAASANSEILLEYYDGWNEFPETYMIGMVMVSILVLCTVSTAFCAENQAHTKSLIFTTKEGPSKDTLAKTAASFSLSVLLWLALSLFLLLLHGAVYGWNGLNCLTGLVMDGYVSPYWQLTLLPCKLYLVAMLSLNLLAILELCGITLYISARSRSAFQSVSTAAVCWAIPICFFFMLRSIYDTLPSSALAYSVLLVLSIVLSLIHCMVYATPVYLINQNIIWELSVMDNRSEILPVYIAVLFACSLCILCTLGAYRRYRRTPEK